MNKEMAEKIAKGYVEKGIVADAIFELYETIGAMAKIIDTFFGDTSDEERVKEAYQNEPYKEYVYNLIEQKYGEGGCEFFKFAVAYEIGRRARL